MSNPLFSPTKTPSRTTKPTKAVNETNTHVRLTHNTFDNSYFLFKTQRYGQYEPFFWKTCVAGDNEPFSNSHNVRSLPFASPILSPMKLNKDYFLVPRHAIQPNTFEYIFKSPNQGDDVPLDAQNVFPLVCDNGDFNDVLSYFVDCWNAFVNEDLIDGAPIALASLPLFFFLLENFLSTGSLLYNMGYKFNPIFLRYFSQQADAVKSPVSFDTLFDIFFDFVDLNFTLNVPDPDNPAGYVTRRFKTINDVTSIDTNIQVVDKFTAISILRNNFGYIATLTVYPRGGDRSELGFLSMPIRRSFPTATDDLNDISPVDVIRMDNIIAYQMACAQYYVNPRVDFLYNAQLYRDNFIQQLRNFGSDLGEAVVIEHFDYNGLPVFYDYFSLYYYRSFFDYIVNSSEVLGTSLSLTNITTFNGIRDLISLVNYVFGYREQLRFGNYITDSRTQALGYGQPGSDVVQVLDGAVSVTDMSQKLVLERFRGAVAHLDGSEEDYLSTMFHEQLPPDYHYPKFIAHSEFAINGEEVSNTTSDNQGNIVTNLKSGDDTAEFNIEINIPCIIVGISYISIPEVYSQIKERSYMHIDRYDEFQTLLQYLGDQQIYNREISDNLSNPEDAYAYVSRNGEYKQRLSQVAGGFVEVLRSWIFTVDLPKFVTDIANVELSNTQSFINIRAHDFEFNRFLARTTGLSLGRGFHFIMQYNNKNVDNRPMDVNPLPLYPSNNL